MTALPDSVKKLIEARTFAHFATLMPDGSPHVVQTWVDHDGDLVLINTIVGSQKYMNAERNPKVALDVSDPANDWGVAVIRGLVKEITTDGADAHIDKMAKKYTGKDKYENRYPGTKRVLIKIEPTHVIAPWTDTSRKSWSTQKS